MIFFFLPSPGFFRVLRHLIVHPFGQMGVPGPGLVLSRQNLSHLASTGRMVTCLAPPVLVCLEFRMIQPSRRAMFSQSRRSTSCGRIPAKIISAAPAAAASVKFFHGCLEKLSYFLQRQSGDFLLLQKRRVYAEDGILVTPSAFDGERENSAQDEPRFVPLPGCGKGIHQDVLAFLHAQVAQGGVFQFRIALFKLVDDAPDVRQRPGTAVAFGT